MFYEFEGKTEQEAIDLAVAELGLEKDQFDIEIMEIQKGSFFKKGYVKIKIHVDDGITSYEKPIVEKSVNTHEKAQHSGQALTTEDENNFKDFFSTLIEKMGYAAELSLNLNSSQLLVRVASEDAPVLIGKKGRNLDALQLLANVYIAKIGYPHIRVVVDCENYRIRREESLVRLAYDTADKVSSSKRSVLLEPMNPYERRLIHTTLSSINYIETKSEGSGLYKQVRVLYKRR